MSAPPPPTRVPNSVKKVKVPEQQKSTETRKKGKSKTTTHFDLRLRNDTQLSSHDTLKSADTSVLLVHRLPQGFQPSHIMDMLLAFTYVKPKNVSEVIFLEKHGICHVEFTSKKHAELAYDTLPGDEHDDMTGKKHKRLKIKKGDYDYVCVCKMKKT